MRLKISNMVNITKGGHCYPLKITVTQILINLIFMVRVTLNRWFHYSIQPPSDGYGNELQVALTRFKVIVVYSNVSY